MNEIIVNLEGKEYQIDIQKAKELGVLKEQDTRCKSWEEFRNKYKNYKGVVLISDITDSNECYFTNCPIRTSEQLTKEEAIAITAFSKLLKLRRDWIGDWEPNYTKNTEKYSIVCDSNLINILSTFYIVHPFSFPTEEMAKDFLKCFKDLFNQCKNII